MSAPLRVHKTRWSKHSAFWSTDSTGRSGPNASIMLAGIFTRTHVPIYICVCVYVCVCVWVWVCVSKLKIVAARRQEYLRRPSQSVSGIHLSFQAARDQVLPLSHLCRFQVPSPARAPGTAGTGALSPLASTFIFCKALHAMATKAVTSTCFPYHMTRQSLPPQHTHARI